MPAATVKSIASKSGKTVAEVEKLWDETKAAAAKKFPKKDAHYWAYVNAVTHRKAGLSEAEKLHFREYVDLLSEDKV